MVDDMRPMRLWHSKCDQYVSIVEAFISGGRASEFVTHIKAVFADEDSISSTRDVSWVVLSQVLQDALQYYDGPEALDAEDLDESQLRARMSFAYDALRALRDYALSADGTT